MNTLNRNIDIVKDRMTECEFRDEKLLKRKHQRKR